MLDYQTYKLLNETLGLSALGLTNPQNLGLSVEGGFPPAPPMPPTSGGDGGGDMGADPSAGMDAPPGDDGSGGDDSQSQDPSTMSRDDLISALVDLGHDEKELDGMEDDDLRDMLTAEQGGDDDGDGSSDSDHDSDHDDDLNGDGGDSTSDGGGDDDSGDNPFAKKPVTPFMKAFMAKEARVMPPEAPGTSGHKLPPPPKGDHKIRLPGPGPQGKVNTNSGRGHAGKMPPDAPGTSGKLPPPALPGKAHKHVPEAFQIKGKNAEKASDVKGKDSKPKDDSPTFMMKKKCGADMDGKIKMCKKCKDDMKEDNNPYARPKGYDPSEAAFLKSIREQLAAANVNQKFSDGMREFKKEDLLLPPNSLEAPQTQTPQPGQPGFAPQGRIGDSFTAEAVADMIKRIEKLEKR